MALTRLKRRRAKGFRAQATKRARARKAAERAHLKRVSASHVRLDRGGYSRSGKYFGTGKKVYHVVIDDKDEPGSKYDRIGYVRANSAEEAKREALARPGHWGIR